MSILPEDVMQRVVETFNTKESRAVALELLTAWDRMPSWVEKGEIGKRHGRSDKTVHKITTQLQEMELFTDKEGSISLYRIALKGKPTVPEVKEPLRTGVTEIRGTEKRALTPAGFLWDEDTEGESENESEPTSKLSEGRMELLEAKFFRMEAEIGKMRENLEAVVPVIRGLTAKVGENPSSDAPQAPARVPLAPDSQTLNPFTGMSGEQVFEMMINQPDIFAQMVGKATSQEPSERSKMIAPPEVVRRMIVEITPYTEMAFMKAWNDGAIDGTLSDFLNQCAYKYMEDRDQVLFWGRKQRRPY